MRKFVAQEHDCLTLVVTSKKDFTYLELAVMRLHRRRKRYFRINPNFLSVSPDNYRNADIISAKRNAENLGIPFILP